MGWQNRESAGLDSHDRLAVNRKLYSLSGCVVSQQTVWYSRFLRNCTNIAWWSLYEVPLFQSKSLSVFQNIKEYIPVLVIGSDGPPERSPRKNKKCYCQFPFFLMKLNAKKCKGPRLCFVKQSSATPFTNWSKGTRNSSFAQGSRKGGGEGGEVFPRKTVQWTLRLSALLSYVPS